MLSYSKQISDTFFHQINYFTVSFFPSVPPQQEQIMMIITKICYSSSTLLMITYKIVPKLWPRKTALPT